MVDQLLQYYGLDWAVLGLGMTSSFLISNMRREGFIFGMLACSCGFVLAILSNQYGFVIYNIILVTFAMRGYIRWGRKQAAERSSPLGAE